MSNLGFRLIPVEASTIAPQVDGVALAILLFSVATLALVFGLMFLFGILYRKGSPRTRVISEKGQTVLEWVWTFITLTCFLGIFVWAAVIYLRMHEPPKGSEEISVLAKQWMWKFQHADGRRELGELHIPVGKPILLTMTSEDVIHSFFVPQFRLKQDVLPGRYTRLWFEATRPGRFPLFCSQYCGTMHASMTGTVLALPAAAYQRWLESGISPPGRIASGGTMADRGRKLFTRLGCISCHAIRPGAVAPSLAGIYGKPVGLSDGTTVLADENYLRESILNPRAKIVEGYQPIMPSFAGVASEEDILDLIAYIKSLEATPKGETPAGPRTPAALRKETRP